MDDYWLNLGREHCNLKRKINRCFFICQCHFGKSHKLSRLFKRLDFNFGTMLSSCLDDIIDNNFSKNDHPKWGDFHITDIFYRTNSINYGTYSSNESINENDIEFLNSTIKDVNNFVNKISTDTNLISNKNYDRILIKRINRRCSTIIEYISKNLNIKKYQ